MAKITSLIQGFKNRWKLNSVIIVVLLGGFFFIRSRAIGPKISYEMVSPRKRDIQQTFSVSGKVTASERSTLHFQAVGRLTYLPAQEGEAVKKGQLLASLDTSALKTALTKAEFDWYAADAAAKKAEDDVRGHAADETFAQRQTRVTAQTARDTAYFQWQQAKHNFVNAYLTTPFDGVVANISDLEIGSNTTANSAIEVFDPQTLYFSGDLDETDLSKVKLHQLAVVKLDAFPNENINSTIDSISLTPKTGVTGTVYELKIPLLTSIGDQRLRLGLNGDAEIVLSEKKNVLTLPIEAVNLQKNDQGKVLTKEGNKMKTIVVKTGIVSDKYVEIVEGLNESSQVYVVKSSNKSE